MREKQPLQRSPWNNSNTKGARILHKNCDKKSIYCKKYWVIFADIYNTDTRLVPELEIVTMFHLCEFRDHKNDAYNAMSDIEMLKLYTDK